MCRATLLPDPDKPLTMTRRMGARRDAGEGCCREDDLCARLGGEEFALALVAPDAQAGALIAERLRSTIAALRIDGHGTAIRVTASIGAHHLDHWPVDPPALLRGLDEALYRAKHGGRNRIEWLDADLTRQAA